MERLAKFDTKSYLTGFEEITEEFTLEAEIEGDLPKDIIGDFIQVGPRGGKVVGKDVHWLDANGMVSLWKIENEKVSFKNRFITTKEIREEEVSGKRKYRGYFTNLDGGWFNNFGKMPRNPANAWIVDAPNGSLLASGGFGIPVEIDPNTLKVIEEKPFLKSLPKRWHNWITEPVHSAKTGSMYILAGYLFGKNLKPFMELVEIPKKGKPTLVKRLNLGDVYLTHTFAVTDKYAVIPISPYRTGFKRALSAFAGLYPYTEAPKWRPNEPLSFYVVSLDGSDTRCIQTEAEHPQHIVNAFEDNGDIIVDCEVYKNGMLPLAELEAARNDTPLDYPAPGGNLVRYTIRGNKIVDKKFLSDEKIIYPFVDEDDAGCSDSPVFAVTNPTWSDSGLLKVDPNNIENVSGIESLRFVGGWSCIDKN